MMRINVTFLALLLALLVTGCSRGELAVTRPVNVDGQFSLSIPSNLVPCNDLHDFAPLQYADERNGYYVVALMESKMEMQKLKEKYAIGDYAEFVEQTIGGAFDTVLVMGRDTTKVNGLACVAIELTTGITDERAPIEVYYHLSVLESPTHFYQLIAWSNVARKEKFAEAAQAMQQSFQELPRTFADEGKPANGR